MQKGNDYSITERSGALFLRFFCRNFLQKFWFQDTSMTSWGHAGGVTVLRRMLQCISKYKKFENQYCVGPTYTNFSRNRASVRWFSLNIFFRVLEQILKNFDFWFYTGIHPTSCQEWFGESLDEKISCANLQSAQFYWRHCRCIFYVQFDLKVLISTYFCDLLRACWWCYSVL